MYNGNFSGYLEDIFEFCIRRPTFKGDYYFLKKTDISLKYSDYFTMS